MPSLGDQKFLQVSKEALAAVIWNKLEGTIHLMIFIHGQTRKEKNRREKRNLIFSWCNNGDCSTMKKYLQWKKSNCFLLKQIRQVFGFRLHKNLNYLKRKGVSDSVV